ncbi:Deoxyhypusine synthase [Sorochytrium milnesiophthora]
MASVQQAPPAAATAAVLVSSTQIEGDTVKGYDFNQGNDVHALLASFSRTGFQATSFGQAVDIINRMQDWRLSDEQVLPDEKEELRSMEVRRNVKCKIFLGYTSNLTSSGLRETIRFLAEHKMVDVIVTTAGGVEEDFIKCLGDTYVGDFSLRGADLRQKGINRIGNLLVPNDNYCKFEDWVMPLLDECLKDQQEQNVLWTPSKLIARLGERINDPSSIYYWCAKNNIPVYCPAITDGSLGDMLYFHSFRNPGLVLDLVQDIRAVNNEAVFARRTGMIILGGGVVKHHICNANLMRNGADYAVYVNTGQEFDGSDAGARPDEAVSWGKIRIDAQTVKIYADATLVFPLLVSQTFAKRYHEQQQSASSSASECKGK